MRKYSRAFFPNSECFKVFSCHMIPHGHNVDLLMAVPRKGCFKRQLRDGWPCCWRTVLHKNATMSFISASQCNGRSSMKGSSWWKSFISKDVKFTCASGIANHDFTMFIYGSSTILFFRWLATYQPHPTYPQYCTVIVLCLVHFPPPRWAKFVCHENKLPACSSRHLQTPEKIASTKLVSKTNCPKWIQQKHGKRCVWGTSIKYWTRTIGH